jgi:hypothetical protein
VTYIEMPATEGMNKLLIALNKIWEIYNRQFDKEIHPIYEF